MSMLVTEAPKKRLAVASEVQTITPAIAAKMLEGNANNRALSEGRVRGLADAMTAGEWRVAQPIILDYNGRLVDGQHRLQAVIRSGVPTKFLVVTGVEPETFSVVDQGKNRTAVDLHHIMGGINSAIHTAVAMSMICGVRANRGGHVGTMEKSKSPGRMAVAKYAIDHDKTIRQFVSIFNRVSYATSPIIGAFCTAHELLDPKTDVLEMAQRFADRVFLGVTDPMNQLTSWCLKYCGRERKSAHMRKVGLNMRRETVYAAAVTAIVAALKGKPMKLLKPSEKDFDELL